MRSQRVMKFGIVRPEMTCEPGVEPSGQFGGINLFRVLENIHDIAQIIQQPFVIGLVGSKLTVAVFSHEPFLKRKMSRDSFQQIAKKGRYRKFGILGVELRAEPVNQTNQLLMLVINGVDTNAIFVLPLQQRH